MTTERDPGTRIVLSWLREDAHENAERVLLRALDEVDATQQRRSRWPAWRTLDMNSTYKFGLAAAAVLLVAIVGYSLLPRSNTIGPPGPSQTSVPTSAPTLVPTAPPTVRPAPSGARVLTEGPLTAGTYYADPFPSLGWFILFTVPDGWHGAPPAAVTPAVGPGGPTGAAVAVQRPMNLYVNPCLSHAQGSPTVSTGTTVDDLVDALAEVTSGDAPPYAMAAPTDTVIGGFEGKRVELLLPSDVDFATCQDGTFWVWDTGPYAQGPGNRWHLWILDVDGTRFVVFAQDFEATTTEVEAELEAIVNSLRFAN